MKCIIKYLGLTALITCFLCGCATNWRVASGKALGTTAQSVDAAMKSWATYVTVANPPQAKEDQVRATYEKYQLAMQAAQVAYIAAVTADNQDAYAQAGIALAAAQADLLNLIQLFIRQ